jgi:hypothetical protein
MKQIMKIVMMILLCIGVALGVQYLNQPDANTREGREQILQEIRENLQWKIHSETLIEDMIVCAIYTDQYDGLAFFEQGDDGNYKWQCTSWGYKGQEIDEIAFVNSQTYAVHWLNSEDAERLEIVFEHDNGTTETMQFDVSDRKIIFYVSPSHSYKYTTTYYDETENIISNEPDEIGSFHSLDYQ